MKKSFVAAMVCAAVLTGANATAAFAGEATGNFGRTGKTTPIKSDFPHAQSICAFSGQNPERFLDPSDPDFEPGRTQSWGQIPKGVRDTLPAELHPGNSCNGHTGDIASGGGE
jgi:hypothetical protein